MRSAVTKSCYFQVSARALLLGGLLSSAAIAQAPAEQVAPPKPTPAVAPAAAPTPMQTARPSKPAAKDESTTSSVSVRMPKVEPSTTTSTRPMTSSRNMMKEAAPSPAYKTLYTPAPSAAPAPLPPTYVLEASSDGSTIYIFGEISNGLTVKFQKLLIANPQAKLLVLNSNGGVVLEGAAIGKIVRDRGMETYVEDYCASACTSILAAGKKRTLSPQAHVGFHQSRNSSLYGWQQKDTTSIFGDALFRVSYTDSKIDPKFITKALSTPFSTMWYPTQQELLAANVITAASDTRTLTLPVSFKMTRADVANKLLQKPFWQKALQADRALTNRAIGHVWSTALLRKAIVPDSSVGMRYILNSFDTRLAEMPDAILNDYAAIMTEKSSRLRDYCFSTGYAPLLPDNDADVATMRGQDFLLRMMVAKPAAKKMADDEALLLSAGLVIADHAVNDSVFQANVPTKICAAHTALMKQVTALVPAESARMMRALIVAGQIRTNKSATGDF
jgi:hypothetical protein